MPRRREKVTRIPIPLSPNSLTVPRRIEKAIRDLAKRAKVDPQQVLEDMCDHGIIQATAMYADLIECRANLQNLKNRPPIPQDDEPAFDRTSQGEGEPEFNGSSENGFGLVSRDVGPVTTVPSGEVYFDELKIGPYDATLGPGLEEEEPAPDHAHEGSASDHLLEMPVTE